MSEINPNNEIKKESTICFIQKLLPGLCKSLDWRFSLGTSLQILENSHLVLVRPVQVRPLQWQTRAVIPLFKMEVRRLCSNSRGITCLCLPGKVYPTVLDRRRNLANSQNLRSGGTMQFSSWSWNTGPVLYPPHGA